MGLGLGWGGVFSKFEDRFKLIKIKTASTDAQLIEVKNAIKLRDSDSYNNYKEINVNICSSNGNQKCSLNFSHKKVSGVLPQNIDNNETSAHIRNLLPAKLWETKKEYRHLSAVIRVKK